MFIQLWEEREERLKRARGTFGDDNPPSPPRAPMRGVYREAICPAGEQWYKVVTSAGKVGTVRFPVEICDPGLEENLWKRLDAKDPARHLKAI